MMVQKERNKGDHRGQRCISGSFCVTLRNPVSLDRPVLTEEHSKCRKIKTSHLFFLLGYFFICLWPALHHSSGPRFLLMCRWEWEITHRDLFCLVEQVGTSCFDLEDNYIKCIDPHHPSLFWRMEEKRQTAICTQHKCECISMCVLHLWKCLHTAWSHLCNEIFSHTIQMTKSLWFLESAGNSLYKRLFLTLIAPNLPILSAISSCQPIWEICTPTELVRLYLTVCTL